MPDIKVLKQSGAIEDFDSGKVINSLKSSGVPGKTAEDIVDKISPDLKPLTTSKELFRMVGRQCDVVARMRYSLKNAIYALGPSGYPFEKYIARVLNEHGFKTDVGRTVQGLCVSHEVDIIAHRNHEITMVECKFHQNGGVYSDVKTALYVHARFEDIRKRFRNSPANPSVFSQGMLVTNTRFSPDAVRYSNCVGLKILGWKYPRKDSLEKMIDRKRAYPVTVLPAATRRVTDVLVRNDLVLVIDLSRMSADALTTLTGLDQRTVSYLKYQAGGLCGYVPTGLP